MATKEDNAKSNSSPEGSKSDGTSDLGTTPEMKENGIIVTAKGDIIPEQIPIDRVPDKAFGNVRQSDIPELIDRAVKAEVKNLLPVGHPEVDLEAELEESPVIDVSEVPEESELEEISDEQPSGLDSESWDANSAKSDFMDWARSEDGSVSKRSLMKWFLDVDAGDGQNPEGYRYPVGAIVKGNPYYCRKALDHSWDLASGKQTGVVNRNLQKKIVFLKNREGMPLTEDQMDFTERHMSAEKEKPDNFVEHDGIPGGFDLVAQAEIKAENDRIEAEKQAEFKKQQDELNRQKAEQEAEQERIKAEKIQLNNAKNENIHARLINSGMVAGELDFNSLYLISEDEILNYEKRFTERKEKQIEAEKEKERIRIEKENNINIAASEIAVKTGLAVLVCKNIIIESNPSDLMAFAAEYINKYNKAKEEAEKELENGKSDIIKLREYVEKLQAVAVPEMKSKKYQKQLQNIYQEVNKFTDFIK
jgi:hypothetical protein